MGPHMPLTILLGSWHPSQLLLETGDAPVGHTKAVLSPPSGLCSSPVLGRAGQVQIQGSGCAKKDHTQSCSNLPQGAGQRTAVLELNNSKGFVSMER